MSDGRISAARSGDPRRHACPHCGAAPDAPCMDPAPRGGLRPVRWHHGAREDVAGRAFEDATGA